MKTHFIALAVTFVLLTKDVEGQTRIEQTVRYPVVPLAVVVQSRLNVSREFDAQDQGNNELYSSVGVTLPDVPCSSTNSCSRFDDPLLICVAGQCTCSPPYCWVYHFESSGWTSKNVFSCSECNQLGSWCNASDTYTCDLPGECWKDGYCHCPEGENYDGICFVVDQSWAYKFTLAGFGVIFLIVIFIICYHLYRDRPWNRPGTWCCGLCKNKRGSRRRRGSCEKTPAFTVQNLYGNQITNFDAESQGPVETAEGSSTSTARQHSGTQTSRGRVGRNSLTSVETVTTNLSQTSITSQQDNAADDNQSEGTSSVPIETPTLNTNLDPKAEIGHPPNSLNRVITSDEHTTTGSSSCMHERCQLCLPKGLSTRSNSSSPYRSTPGHSLPLLDTHKSTPLDQHPKIPPDLEKDTKCLELEITSL